MACLKLFLLLNNANISKPAYVLSDMGWLTFYNRNNNGVNKTYFLGTCYVLESLFGDTILFLLSQCPKVEFLNIRTFTDSITFTLVQFMTSSN